MRMRLEEEKVQETIERLVLRISDRFPGSGLLDVCNHLLEMARETRRTVACIDRPNPWLRALSLGLIALLICAMALLMLNFKLAPSATIVDFIQTSEAGANLLILLGLAIWFLWTLELKHKRARVLQSLNRLREIAHIIDMHQLAKDPDGLSLISRPTEHSPQRDLTRHELGRYLDYCSEMLSIISKLGYLYVCHFDDDVAVDAVNDLENLTTGLARKIWQKIMTLRGETNKEQETG